MIIKYILDIISVLLSMLCRRYLKLIVLGLFLKHYFGGSLEHYVGSISVHYVNAFSVHYVDTISVHYVRAVFVHEIGGFSELCWRYFC